MKQYHDLLEKIIAEGAYKEAAREGMPGTKSYFGYQMRFDLSKGFPIVTTKKMFWRGVVVELLWFLNGDSNIKFMVDQGVNWWNGDAYNYYLKKCKLMGENNPIKEEAFIERIKEGTLAPNNGEPLCGSGYLYGSTGVQYPILWRSLPAIDSRGNVTKIDQIKEVLTSLMTTPYGRRHIVDSWNPATVDDMALQACHALFQFNCRKLTLEQRIKLFDAEKGQAGSKVPDSDTLKEISKQILDGHNVPAYYLDLELYQRSMDTILGCPANISSYALMIHLFAKICNMVPGEFIHSVGDAHVYDNHSEQVKEQLSRDPEKYKLPELKISIGEWQLSELRDTLNFRNITADQFKLIGYESYPAIKAELSVGTVK